MIVTNHGNHGFALQNFTAVPRKTRIMSNETRKPDLLVTAIVLLEVLSKTASCYSPRSILKFRGTTETFANKRVLTTGNNHSTGLKKSQIAACP